MTNFRFIPLAITLITASALTACNSTPAMTVGTASASSVASPDQTAKMDAQMQHMHDKMMNAKTPQERGKLMAEHMKTMQEGMAIMDGMPSAGMGTMKGSMDSGQPMMEKRMEMMQAMMKMMMDRIPTAPGK